MANSVAELLEKFKDFDVDCDVFLLSNSGIRPKDYNEDYIFKYSIPNMVNINDQTLRSDFKLLLECLLIDNACDIDQSNFKKLILKLVVASSWNQQIFNKFKQMESIEILETDLFRNKNHNTVQLLDYSIDQLKIMIFSICTLIMRLKSKSVQSTELKYQKLNQIINQHCQGASLPFLNIKCQNLCDILHYNNEEYLAALAWVIMIEEDNPYCVFNKIAQFTLLESFRLEGLPLYSSGQKLMESLNIKCIDHFYEIFSDYKKFFENGLKEFVKFSNEVKNYQNQRWKYCRVFDDGYFWKMSFKKFDHLCLFFYYSLDIRTNSDAYEKVLNVRKKKLIPLNDISKESIRQFIYKFDLIYKNYLIKKMV